MNNVSMSATAAVSERAAPRDPAAILAAAEGRRAGSRRQKSSKKGRKRAL